MSIEKKVGDRLPPGAECYTSGNVKINVDRDEETRQITDVTCEVVEKDEYVVLHQNEALVRKGEHYRFYKFEGNEVKKSEGLCAGKPEVISEEVKKSDLLLIESARRFYEKALEHPEEFKAEEFKA